MSKYHSPDLKLTQVDINLLKPYSANARVHTKGQIKKIAKSIKLHGFINPVIADQSNGIIAGHGRVEAARTLGMTSVPVLRVEHLTPEQVRAYIIADNRLAELASWDRDLLAVEFKDLMSLDVGLDLTSTGFSMPEIDKLVMDLREKPFEDLPPTVDDITPAISRLGDLWFLGNHRLFCGDALEQASYASLLAGQKVEMVFADPPYNVRINGHALKDTRCHGEFAMASGEMSEAEFIAFLRQALSLMATNSVKGSIHFICMDWRHLWELQSAARGTYTELKNLCVWNKPNGGMGSMYRSKHECVMVYKSGKASHINNIELGKNGRYRTNVWEYGGQTAPYINRAKELAMHPTVKPVTLIADAMLDCSNPKGLILDPFGGSGTTVIAAEKTGRQAHLIEIDPRYVDVTIKRWQALTGQQAVLAETGQTYAAICEKRGGENV